MRSSILRSVKTLAKPAGARGYSSESVPDRKVAVLGAAGGIGQPLALLMKLNPLVSRLALYDIANTPGVAADVGHINTRSEVFFTLLSISIMIFLYTYIYMREIIFESVFEKKKLFFRKEISSFDHFYEKN